MALCKRGGVWWSNFKFNGRKIQFSTKVKSKTVAREIEAAYRVKLAKGEVGIEPKEPAPNFKVAVKDFLAHSKGENRPNTYRRYETSSKPLLRYFKDIALDRITPEAIEKYKTSRRKHTVVRTDTKIRPATINRELACLKAVFNFHKLSNPVSEVKYLQEDNDQMTVLTVEEQDKYLLAASQPLRDIATLMLETGMRPEEVYRIRKENVHLDREYLYNPYGKTKAAKRKVPLSEVAIEVLRSRLAKAKGHYLFVGRMNRKGETDKPLLKVNNAHYSALERSKVRQFRLYDLRHTWASRMAMAGVDLVTLAALLGHSKLAMVTRYAHPTEAHQFEALKKLQAFMSKKAA